MQIDVVEIPEQFKDNKSVDGSALAVYLEDVKTMLAAMDISDNKHPIAIKTSTLMMLVQLLWNENDQLKGRFQEAIESLNHITEKYKDLLDRYDKHLDEELAFQKEMMNTTSEMMDKFALKS